MSFAVEIKDLEFQYPNQKQTQLKISAFTANKQEKLFVLGPSGSGKTTFLELLSGILTPQKGLLKVFDQDLVNMSHSAKDRFRGQNFGYIFQNFNLIPYLNVQDNIELVRSLNNKPQDLELLNSLASALGVSALLKQSVLEISIGQQQRVAALRALYNQPQIILADEPTSSLDYDHREKFIQTLFQLCDQQKITLFFVSHDRSLEKLFDRSVSILEFKESTAKL